MTRTTRSRNLDLIRWLHFGHESTAKLLAPVTNANYLSRMATGEMEITDRKARSIERASALPPEWLDRDNIEILKMSSVDHQLCKLISMLSDKKKVSLLQFLARDA